MVREQKKGNSSAWDENRAEEFPNARHASQDFPCDVHIMTEALLEQFL
jgi:hypothetical protein